MHIHPVAISRFIPLHSVETIFHFILINFNISHYVSIHTLFIYFDQILIFSTGINLDQHLSI